MPTIRFIQPDGSTRELSAPDGTSAMQAAIGAGLSGIVAECGGSAMCATCHVYVDEAWADRLPAPLANELEEGGRGSRAHVHQSISQEAEVRGYGRTKGLC